MRPRSLRLGEILEQRGRVAHEQTLRALRNQKVLGGRLGTCLLEIDAVSEEELLAALSEIHGVPPATAEDLRNIPAEVIALIPPKVALRCMAVPFYASGSNVKVALANARDLAVQDEINFVVGRRARWHVASDLRIHEALERWKGAGVRALGHYAYWDAPGFEIPADGGPQAPSDTARHLLDLERRGVRSLWIESNGGWGANGLFRWMLLTLARSPEREGPQTGL